MRLQELLAEKINLSHYGPDFEQEINSAILKAMQDLLRSSLVFGFSGQEIEEMERKKDISKYLKKFIQILIEQIEIDIKYNLQEKTLEILQNENSERSIQVKFLNNINDAHGTANYNKKEHIVNLNSNYFMTNKLRPKLSEYFYSSFLENFEDNESFTTLLKEILHYTIKHPDEFLHPIKNFTKDMASVFIHELVHVIQHQRQFKKGRERTEYRSYLEPDKEKFYKEIDKFSTQGPETTDLSYKLHKSSPQEIAAHAHNIVIKMVNDYDLNKRNIEDFNDFIKKLTVNDIKAYVDEYINYFDPNNRLENKVRKRYLKLTYQQLMDTLETIRYRLKNKS